ncbi:hypothetical protein EJ03DRAFT_377022 [Teratosphaeria nubilosa]|uniref:DUF7918 domain-containing protein n=1 Tax=Teratosphaeria nubilosa TaxID=161662 RepID=A0A6G1L0F7_9PEZI|nr:hypothetical protein EJ03DRAFT_377022 [Teratosphaeria nubilosa]
MAISPGMPGVEVTVVVDGAPLKEHVDAELEEEDRTVTRYIEATSGKKFEIQIAGRTGVRFFDDCIVIDVFVDGQLADNPLVRKREYKLHGLRETVKGAAISARAMKEFSFSSLETVSDGHTLNGELSKFKELGVIKVTFTHKNVVARSKETLGFGADKQDDKAMVSEKALKGQSISHTVSYGKTVMVPKLKVFSTQVVRGLPDPYMTFVFHYRSLDALKSMLIIPRTPTPPPLYERDIDTLNAEELQASATKIKRENPDEIARPRKKARPTASSTQLELDDDGVARASSTPTVAGEPEVIVLD